MKDPLADVGSTMYDDIPPAGHIIDALFNAIDAKRKAVAAEIGVPGHIEPQAAFIRLGLIGKRIGKFPAGRNAMGYVRAI